MRYSHAVATSVNSIAAGYLWPRWEVDPKYTRDAHAPTMHSLRWFQIERKAPRMAFRRASSGVSQKAKEILHEPVSDFGNGKQSRATWDRLAPRVLRYLAVAFCRGCSTCSLHTARTKYAWARSITGPHESRRHAWASRPSDNRKV